MILSRVLAKGMVTGKPAEAPEMNVDTTIEAERAKA
jgi:hypothetical protein